MYHMQWGATSKQSSDLCRRASTVCNSYSRLSQRNWSTHDVRCAFAGHDESKALPKFSGLERDYGLRISFHYAYTSTCAWFFFYFLFLIFALLFSIYFVRRICVGSPPRLHFLLDLHCNRRAIFIGIMPLLVGWLARVMAIISAARQASQQKLFVPICFCMGGYCATRAMRLVRISLFISVHYGFFLSVCSSRFWLLCGQHSGSRNGRNITATIFGLVLLNLIVLVFWFVRFLNGPFLEPSRIATTQTFLQPFFAQLNTTQCMKILFYFSECMIFCLDQFKPPGAAKSNEWDILFSLACLAAHTQQAAAAAMLMDTNKNEYHVHWVCFIWVIYRTIATVKNYSFKGIVTDSEICCS